MRSDAEDGCKIEEFEHRLKMPPMGTYFVPLIQRKQSMSIINMIPRHPWGLSEIIKDMWLDLIIVEKTRKSLWI